MASWQPEADICLTDSEDEEDFQRDFHGREAMLFVVDANLYADSKQFEEALLIIRGAFLSGLLANDKDLMGIVFANTNKSPAPFEASCLENISVPPSCAVFLPPRQLTKPIVEHFLRFLVTALDDFGKEYGIAENGGCGSFKQMLRFCLNLFDFCGYSLNNSTIVYLTARATPHPPESQEFQWALQKAKDLEGKDIEFHVIPMVDEFNYDVFYKEFLTLLRDVELDSFVPPDSHQLREQLTNRKLRQDFLKRCLGHFKFSLGPNLDISVQYYNYFKRRSYPRKVKILCKDNSIVKQKYKICVRKQDTETMEFSEEHEVKMTGGWYEINLGNMPIRISPEQINRVRNLHAPGMMLLGFKPKTELPENFFYKPCNFMYPDDQFVIGSKRLFRALWQRCLDRDKIAVCLFMRKRKSIPRYVALVPVRAADSAEDKSFRSLLSGDGFKIVYLPMGKHIRMNNLTDWNSIENTAPEEGVELLQKVAKKLRIKYQPHLIKDPLLEKLQSNLLALALDITTENDDLKVMPDAEEQDARIAEYLPEVDEVFGIDLATVKRRVTHDDGARTAKIQKPSDDGIKQYDFIEDLIEKKAINLCTVAQLRYILSEHFGINMPKAQKQVLIDQIYEQAAK